MKFYLFLIGFFCVGVTGLNAQDEVYYYAANYRPVEDIENAIHFKEVFHRSERAHIVKSYSRNGDQWEPVGRRKIVNKKSGYQLIKIRSVLFFSDKIHRYYEILPDGKFHFSEAKDGQELRNGYATKLIPLSLEGKLTEYYSNGNLKSIAYYQNNQLIRNENWLRDGSEYINNFFYSVDKEPEYKPGFGMFRNFILANLRSSGYDITKVDEKIVLGWVVMEDGNIAGVHRVEGKLKKLSEILINIVENLPGTWSPAKLGGENVRYYMTIPFNFRQDFESFDTIELNDGYLIWD